jgi:hypothetical protein
MRKEVRTLHVTCDLCGEETKEPWISVSEERNVGVLSIRHDIWYGGTFELKDFCKPCQWKLVAFLESCKAIGRGTKVT